MGNRCCVCVDLIFSGPGQTYSISIFINHYVERFGWSRTQISSYYSIATLLAGLTLPFVGKIIDSFGHRKMIVMISFLLSMGALWMSNISTPLMLMIGFFILRLFGQGSMTLLPNTLVPAWFIKHRGKALSLMALGSVIGSAVIPPLNNYLLESMGVEKAWQFWSIMLLLIMAPIGWFVIRNSPDQIGLMPDGIRKKHYSDRHVKYSAKTQVSTYSWNLQEAMRTRAFWLLLICMVIPSMVNTGITFHLVSIINEKGFDAGFAALILSIIALSQFPMTFAAGFVADRVKVHYVKAANFLLYLIVILLLQTATSPVFLILFAVFQGFFIAFDSVSTGVIWPNYFGSAHLGSIRSITMMLIVMGSALGPLPFGIAYDHFGGYREILWIMMLFPLLGASASLLSPRPSEPAVNI